MNDLSWARFSAPRQEILLLPLEENIGLYNFRVQVDITHDNKDQNSRLHIYVNTWMTWMTGMTISMKMTLPGDRLWWRKSAGHSGHLGSPANNIKNFSSSV